MIKLYIMEIMNWKEDLVKVEAFTDCRDVYEALMGTKATKKGDQLSCIDVSAVKRYMENDECLPVQWVPKEMQLADQLTEEG